MQGSVFKPNWALDLVWSLNLVTNLPVTFCFENRKVKYRN